MTRLLISILSLVVPLTVAAEPKTPPLKKAEQEQQTEPAEPPLLEAEVFDAVTGIPIKGFRFLPGVPYRGFDRNGLDPIAVWQPHLIKEVKAGKFEWSRKRTYKDFCFRIEADGYQPAETEWFQRDELKNTKSIRIDLKPDPGIAGNLLTPDGKTASGATIGIAMPNRRVSLEDGKIKDADKDPPAKLSDWWRRPLIVRTNERGEFRLPTETSPAVLVVFVHQSGYLQIPATELRSPEILKLHGWGSIEGQVRWKDKIGDGETISLSIMRELIYPEMVYQSEQVVSDEEGRFRFEKLPPGRAQVSRYLKEDESDGGKRFYQFPVMHVDILPGEPTKVTVGGKGKTIRGQLTGYDSYDGISVSLAPETPSFMGFAGRSENPAWAGFAALRESSLGPLFFREKIEVNKDGTFRFENVIPEDYQIFVRSEDKSLYKVISVRMRSLEEETHTVEIPLAKQRLPKP